MKNAASILCLCFLVSLNGCKDPATTTKNASGAATNNNQSVEAEKQSGKSGKYGESQLKKLQTEFKSMLAAIELTEDQKSDLEIFQNDFVEQASAWFEENGPTITKIQRKALSAGKKKDLATLKRMESNGDKATVTRLVNEQRDMLNNHRVNIEKQLPPDQKKKWQSKVITDKLLEYLEPLELSKEQVEAIENLAPQAIGRLNRNQLENWRGYGTANLEDQFESKVLSKQQRNSFEEMKNRTRTRMLKWSDRFF